MSDHTDPAVIEREVNATRARLDRHLHELSQRLSPGQLLDEALGYLRSSGGADFARNLTETVRERPFPVVLTGVGISWMMMAGLLPHERVIYRERATDAQNEAIRRAWEAGKAVARNDAESDSEYDARVAAARGTALGLAQQAGETARAFGERVQDALFAARDSAADTADGLSGGARRAAGWIGDTAHRVRDTAADTSNRLGDAAGEGYARARDVANRSSDILGTIAENPILLGAVGLLTGAAFGALLPTTAMEQEYLDEPAATARDAVRNTAREVVERGKRIAGDGLGAADSGGQHAGHS